MAESVSMGLKCENVNLQSQLDIANEKYKELQFQYLKLQKNLFFIVAISFE